MKPAGLHIKIRCGETKSGLFKNFSDERILAMRKLSLLVMVLLLALSAVVTGAQDEESAELPDFIAEARTECENDLSGETYQLWHLGDLSGPFAPITQPVLAGFSDAVAYFNERGGVCGAEITLPDPTTIDTGGSLDQTQIIYDRVSGEDPLMLVLYSSADSELLRNQLAEDEIPVVISAGSIPGLYGESGDEPGWVFATNPLYVDQFGHFCEYASDNLEDPVIGYISWDSAFGRAAFTEEAIAYCDSMGVEVLEEPELFATGSDISGSVQNLVDQGANVLYTNSLATGPANVAATVNNLGLRDQVTLAGVNWALDTSVGFLGLQSITSQGLPSVNGLIGSMPFVWWTETDNPGVQVAIEMADANERDALTRNIAYILGVTSVDIFIETLVQTANRVGPEFTGADVYETLEELDYNVMDLLQVDFQDGEIRDLEGNRMSVLTYAGAEGGTVLDGEAPLLVDGGDGNQIPVPVVVPLEDFRATPDLRPGGADDPMAGDMDDDSDDMDDESDESSDE
jgi:branched-chain amino acid transport system substrate-binding protein